MCLLNLSLSLACIPSDVLPYGRAEDVQEVAEVPLPMLATTLQCDHLTADAFAGSLGWWLRSDC